MYYSLDSMMTCREVSCASPAGLRQPWVPLHGVPKRPGYPNFGSMYLNLGSMYLSLDLMYLN